jgi:hypothetical protein
MPCLRRVDDPPLLRLVVAMLAFGGACSCRAEPRAPPRKPPAAPTSANAIPIASLNGKLLGETFTLHDGRYYVDRRRGYQRIDIQLSASNAKTPCGDLDDLRAPSVWLRRHGDQEPAPAKHAVRVSAGGPWQVHYQVHEHEQWLGNGDANALFVVDQVDPDMVIRGALQACFRDATGSCVAGRFAAHYCTIGIDAPVRGTDAMKRPPRRPLPPAATSGPDAGRDAPPTERGVQR